MKKIIGAIIALALASADSLQARWVTFINHSSDRLGLVTLNKPFKRAHVPSVSLTWLEPGEEMEYNTRGRLVGWYQRGMPVNYTVLGDYDRIIGFVEHAGEIKSLHGAPRERFFSNDNYNPLMIETKNPNSGAQDCRDCAENCYDRWGSVAHCSCLDWCWDKTQDMKWILNPGRSIDVIVASGAKLGLSELYYE